MQQIERDFYSFMEEYTTFLEKMLEDEKEKFAALNSRDLRRIENSISSAQANTKKLANYESKRIEFQREAGWAGLSFSELIEKASEAKRSWLQQLFARFEKNVNEIRFRNEKSMTVARDNMLDIDPTAVLPGTKLANPYTKMKKREQDGQGGMLETKI